MDFRVTIMSILLERDGQNCMLCEFPFTLLDPPTIDHIISQKAGGSDDIGNLQLLHGKCNGSKGCGIPYGPRIEKENRKELANREMEKYKYNKYLAAKNLNISVRTLYRWLEL